jgi:hypothetical protein
LERTHVEQQVRRGSIAGGLVAAVAAVAAVIVNAPVISAVSNPSAAHFVHVAPFASPYSGTGFQLQAKCIMLGETKDAPSSSVAA